MSANEVVARVISDLRDERERLSVQISEIDAALSKLGGARVEAPKPPVERKPRAESSPRGAVQAELLQWLGEHPGSGIADVCQGLGWERDRTRAALANAKKTGLIVGEGAKVNMKYTVVMQ